MLKKLKKNISNNFSEGDLSEILEYHPNWIIRWGVSVIAVIVLLLIFVTTFVEEPEVIKSGYEFVLKSKSTGNGEAADSIKKSIKYSIYIDINEKNKIIKGRKYEILLYGKTPEKSYSLECIIDSVKFNPDKNKFELSVGSVSGLNKDMESMIENNGIVSGDAGIIVDKKSLFNRIFSKYIENNRF